MTSPWRKGSTWLRWCHGPDGLGGNGAGDGLLHNHHGRVAILPILSPRRPGNGEPTIRVFGGATADAVVDVNGVPVEVNELGIFSTTVTLEDGPNFIEVIATDIRGNVRFQTVAVFYLP